MSFQVLLQVVPFVVLIGLGFTVGGFVERAHFRRLERRERELADITVTDLRGIPLRTKAELCGMVTGEVVIASDYFKTFVATIKKMIGGDLRTYETLMERARREALVRMLESARQLGANHVANVRFASSNISSGMTGRRNRRAAMVEMYAYGTALRLTDVGRGDV
ncbi:MAG: heavy metal-binding domain-containing protein [Planctomycetes bacterium]|nr:heavy metal-binding domain-containing protein [Planctomycetota bacterium]